MATLRSLRSLAGPGLLALLLSAPAVGQPASLLLDINKTTYGAPRPEGEIRDLHRAGDRLFFHTRGGGDADALWSSDGTPAGTESLCPGRCTGQPFLLGNLGRLMLWTAGSPSFTWQLWRSDGTHPGTFPLTEPALHVPLSGAEPPRHAFLGSFFYFSGCSGPDAATDCDLWRTDGTAAGTRIFHEAPRSLLWLQAAGDRLYYLAQEDAGASLWVTDGRDEAVRLRHFQGEPGDLPRSPAAAGRRLFFRFRTTGEEVWTSDGTAAGTRPVARHAPGSSSFFDPRLRPIGSRVYFLADDGLHGAELWRTDGTAAGTLRLTDLENERPFTYDSLLGEAGGSVVFRAMDDQGPFRIWTSRGTPASTTLLPCQGCEVDQHTPLVASGGKVFFLAGSGASLTLWATDGTAAGTRKVRRLCITESCTFGSLLPWNGGVLATVKGGDSQIWFSDGTPEGTKPFTGLTATEAVDEPLEVAELDGGLYFLGVAESAKGLWVRDRRGETRPVRTLPISGPASQPRLLGSAGSRLLFKAWDGQAFGLWSSAGTPETTLPLELPGLLAEEIEEPVPAAGLLFFQTGNLFREHDLWRTDGTPQGTFVVARLQGRALTVPFQGSLYILDGTRIWKTDGTVPGTVETGDLPAETRILEAAAAGPNGIYLKAVSPSAGAEFWFTDGTGAGTRQITQIGPGVTGWNPEFTAAGAQLYFTHDARLWRSDGTAGGTVALDVLPPSETQTTLTSHQGALYLFTWDFNSGKGLRLWRTDGTAAGTVELGRFLLQETYDFPLRLTPFAGKLFFNVDDGVHGIELWATDGTPAGTALVRDLHPGRPSSAPSHPTVAGGRLFFTADDGLHGMELWQTDGTAAGTRLVQDLRPQASSGDPKQLTVAGDDLFFSADDGITGREVWVLPLAVATACKPSPTRLCLSNGRYAVEATWNAQGRRGTGQARMLTADTGWFWFFDPANVEVVLKVLDGRGVNEHTWVFYGALSDVEYTLTVTDTETGLARRYINPPGVLASTGDTFAFGPFGASAQSATTASVARPSPLALVDRRIVPAAATGACAPTSTRLCLDEARFAVEIAWKDFAGKQGTGKAVELTGDAGWFWFFDAANVEIVIKVLDGTAFNGHHWVFYGALSSVEYSVTVTDTQTGEIKTWRNPSGRLASVADTGAF